MSGKLKVNFKLWLEKEGGPVIGQGGVKLLEEIHKTGSLQTAIRNLGISYRYAWGYLKKMERVVGEPVIKSFKGGFKGGGGTEVTSKGLEIIKIYNRFETYLVSALRNPTLWEAYGLKTDEMNEINGVVEKIRLGEDVAEITVHVSEPPEIISIITVDSIKNLGITDNDEVNVVVKATEITLDKRVKT